MSGFIRGRFGLVAVAAALIAAPGVGTAAGDDTGPPASAEATDDAGAAARSAPPATDDSADRGPVQPQPKVMLALRYQEAADATASPDGRSGGGGLVGAMNRVTAAMQGAGTGEATPVRGASALFTLEPVIHEPDAEDGSWTVTLKVTLSKRVLDELPPASRTPLQQELRMLQGALERWSHTLNREQELRLILQGAAQVPLAQPLALLHKWQAEPVVLTLERSLKPRVVAARLYEVGPGDRLHRVEEVVAGIPLVIELWFNRPIEADRIAVRLRAQDRPLALPATRLEPGGRRYLTGPFLPESGQGLPTPTLPAPASDGEDES